MLACASWKEGGREREREERGLDLSGFLHDVEIGLLFFCTVAAIPVTAREDGDEVSILEFSFFASGAGSVRVD